MGSTTIDLHQIMGILEGLPVVEKFRFLAAKTDEEHVSLSYSFLREKNILPFGKKNELKDTKSKERSVQLRNAGNKAFGKKKPNFSQVLLLFTESVANAPYPKSDDVEAEELAAAFANRSSVLFMLRKYPACLSDVEQGLLLNCSEELQKSLLKRRQSCIKAMGMKIDGSMSSQGNLQMLKSEFDTLQIDYESKPVRSRPVETLKFLPQKTYGEHANIPCASNCMDIKYSPEMGRFIEASRNIRPGDVIMVEEPFASVVKKGSHYTHCYNCLQRYDAMIPCKYCAMAMYCCEDCRTASWKNAHHIECVLMPSLIKINGIDQGWLSLTALRILLVAVNTYNSVRGLYQHIQEAKCYEKTKGVNKDGQYIIDSDYDTIHYLPQNIAERKKDASMATLAACILIGLETHTDFFKDDPNNMEIKYFVGGLLLRYINLASNVYRVADQNARGKNRLELFEFGSAIYAVGSLFNHSCCPNVFRCFRGGTMAMVAIRPIKKGEQIYSCYGVSYIYEELDKRMAFLSDYLFTCKCEACVCKWPTKQDLALLGSTYLCSKCSATLPHVGPGVVSVFMDCPYCGHMNSLLTYKINEQEVLKIYTSIKEQVNAGIPVACFSIQLGKLLVKLNKFLKPPSTMLVNCQELLQDSFMQGGSGNIKIKLHKQ